MSLFAVGKKDSNPKDTPKKRQHKGSNQTDYDVMNRTKLITIGIFAH